MIRNTLILIFVCIAFFSIGDVLLADDIDIIRTSIYAWRDAWQSKNIDSYRSFYSPHFRSRTYDYHDWMDEKTRRFKKAAPISLIISEPKINFDGNQAVARFNQKYECLSLSKVGEKKLILAKTNGMWRIVAEEWEKLVGLIAIVSDRTDLPDPVDKIIVKSIEFNVEKNRPEKVYIELNRFSVPQLIALEGKNPRIAIDIHNVFLLNENNTIPVNGYLIKRIRTYYSRNSETLRVVLDLNPVENYNAKPTYYKVDNKYCLEISHASLKSRKTPLGETQKGKPFSDVYPQP